MMQNDRHSLRPFKAALKGLPLALAVLFYLPGLALAQFAQQGPKLVGTGAIGKAFQGQSVALSADGNTAIVGGPYDGGFTGAAWAFTRRNGLWRQQGSKLIGRGMAGKAPFQGQSVALSGDGNTAIVGGPYDNSGVGAAWVFTRSKGVWTQQGEKLVGKGAIGKAFQGQSVALSANGDTAIIGGSHDDGFAGAAWVFVRSNGVWAQQGDKLIGAGAAGKGALQGQSVALSADGNTAVIGGPFDNSRIGAAWVFFRSNGVWTQQGGKLVGDGAVGPAEQGSVALSADGNTVMIGGLFDNHRVGAMWAFTRRKGLWTQEGPKLVGAGALAGAGQHRVALSADGDTAIMGGPFDNSNIGAAWVFNRSHGVWKQQDDKLVGRGAVGNAVQGQSVALSGDGNTAIVGGPYDNGMGAAWVYDRTGAPVPPPTKVIGLSAEIPGQCTLLDGFPNSVTSSETTYKVIENANKITLMCENRDLAPSPNRDNLTYDETTMRLDCIIRFAPFTGPSRSYVAQSFHGAVSGGSSSFGGTAPGTLVCEYTKPEE